MLSHTNNYSFKHRWHPLFNLLFFMLIFSALVLTNVAKVFAADAGTKTNPISVSETSYSSVVTQVKNARHASSPRQRVFVKKSPATTDLDIVAQNVINDVNNYNASQPAYDLYQTPLLKYKIGQEDGVWYIDFKMLHLNTSEQSTQGQSDLTSILQSLSLSGKTQYQKTKAIYDYTIANLEFDHNYKYTVFDVGSTGKIDPEQIPYFMQYLMYNTNIISKIIYGTLTDTDDNAHQHAWNIAKIGSYWYNFDTLPFMLSEVIDEPEGCRRVFLMNNEDFVHHERNAEYNTDEFNTTYNMTTKSYNPGSTAHSYTPCNYPLINKF